MICFEMKQNFRKLPKINKSSTLKAICRINYKIDKVSK